MEESPLLNDSSFSIKPNPAIDINDPNNNQLMKQKQKLLNNNNEPKSLNNAPTTLNNEPKTVNNEQNTLYNEQKPLIKQCYRKSHFKDASKNAHRWMQVCICLYILAFLLFILMTGLHIKKNFKTLQNIFHGQLDKLLNYITI